MSVSEQIKTAIGAMSPSPAVQTFWGEVRQVDWENQEAVVYDQTEQVDIPEVLLGLGSVAMKPKPDTACLVGIIDNQPTQCFLIWANEVEELKIENETLKINQQVSLSADGLQIVNKKQNVGVLFRRLCDEVKKIVVIQGTSPDITALDQIKSDSEKVLI